MVGDCNLTKKPKTVNIKKHWKLNEFELEHTVLHANNMFSGQKNNMYKKR